MQGPGVLLSNCFDIKNYFYDCEHGRTPIESFFSKNPRLLGLGRQIGPKKWGILGTSAKLTKKNQKVLMKIEEMADVFLNSANFVKHTFLNLAPSSGYAVNLKALIKVSKVS